MFETVSVDDALARGKRMLSYPLIFILFLPTIAAFIWVVGSDGNGWFLAGAFILGFALAWLYWSVTITKWRLWAFDNVRNVHELKKRAIKEKLIWEDGSVFGNTEIWSAEQRQQWEALQHKFQQKDIFHDDLTVPNEVAICYSKYKAAGSLIIGVIALAGAVWLYYNQRDGLLITLLVLGLGLWLSIMGFRHLSNRNAQLTLSNEGVKLTDGTFYPWVDIVREDTKVVSTGKNSTTYFTFYAPDGEKEVNISELAITQRRLDALLRTYRGRSDKKLAGRGVGN